MKRRLLTGVLGLCLATGAQAVAWQSCMPQQPIPITVRIGAHSPPVSALLRGGVLPRINVVERDTGRVLWTAADAPPAVQQFPQMRSAFAGSFAAIDLDGDGVHDRIYAGDLAGRLWRFDLHQGAEPAHWASGGIWADFSAVGVGFVAAPDVSLSTPPGQKPWLNVAAGTAHTSDSVVSNRFYVLRDRHAFDAWTDADYLRWRALHEADLVALGTPTNAVTAPVEQPGYFFDLGAGEALAPALTVSGRATLAISSQTSGSQTSGTDPCQVAITIASFDIDTAKSTSHQQAPPDGTSDAPVPTLVLPVGSGLVLTRNAAGQAICTLGPTHVAACDVSTRPVPIYWRRQDAD